MRRKYCKRTGGGRSTGVIRDAIVVAVQQAELFGSNYFARVDELCRCYWQLLCSERASSGYLQQVVVAWPWALRAGRPAASSQPANDNFRT